MTEDIDNQDDEIYKSCPNCSKLIKWEAVICPYCNSSYPEVEFQELRGGMLHPVFSKKNFQTPDYKRPLSVTAIIVFVIVFISALLVSALLKNIFLAIIVCFPIFIIITFILIFINLRKNKKRMIGFLIASILMIIVFVISLILFEQTSSIKSSLGEAIQGIDTANIKTVKTTLAPESTIAPTTTILEVSTTFEATTTSKGAYIFSIGDLIDFRGIILTVTKFEKSMDYSSEKLKEGMEYIVIDIKITNQTESKISYSPLDFEIQNSAGHISEMIYSLTTLETGELAANDAVEGTIVFAEAKDASELILLYQPDFFNDKDIIKVSIK